MPSNIVVKAHGKTTEAVEMEMRKFDISMVEGGREGERERWKRE